MLPARPVPALVPTGPSPTTVPSATTSPSGVRFPPATGPGSVITIQGGPNATADIPGPHSDASDFFGSALAIVAILAAIALTRLLFRRRGSADPPAEGPR